MTLDEKALAAGSVIAAARLRDTLRRAKDGQKQESQKALPA